MKAFFKMICLLVLCPVLLAAGVQTLTIDSQLGTSIEDCFDRIAIGSQIPNNAIYRNISELTTRECEQLCKQDKQCQVYDYGVGAKGNATCDLSNASEKDIRDNLSRHPDYDVYVRRIQCEQGPPSPLLPEFNDPESPAHRPIFRPGDDEAKRPLADDVTSDLRPFESSRPHSRPIRPYVNSLNDERPDVYDPRPAYDRPPSYGDLKPQNTPYFPETPIRPNRPKPDPYDVLQFQNGYNRPNHVGLWRPPAYDDPRPRPDPQYPPSPADELQDIYGPKPMRPNRPELYPMDEKPIYQYIYRPNRKPYKPLQDDHGYVSHPVKPINDYNKPGNDYPKPIDNYPSKPDAYGQNEPGPVGPPYKPTRPMYNYPINPDRPTYSYNDQYASGYGQGQYEDNSIHVEIHDPIPQKPLKPKPIYGPMQDSYHLGFGGYGQNPYSQTSQYTGTITEIGGYGQTQNKPYGTRPQRPSYDTPVSNYGDSSSNPHNSDGYSSQKPQKPYDTYVKPGYSDTQHPYDSFNNHGSYGSNTNRPYGQNKPEFDYTTRPGYGHKPENDRPDYVKPSRPNHGHKPLYDNQSNYGSSQGYGSTHTNYDSTQSTYGSSQGNYIKPEPSYGSSQSDYVKPQPSYGSSQSDYVKPQPSYGSSQSDYVKPQPSYGSSQSDYVKPQPSYGSSQSNYVKPQPSYGSSQSDYGTSQPSYGSSQTNYVKPQPSYGSSQSDYGTSQPSYGSSQTNYVKPQPSYGSSQSDYVKPQPSYGSSQSDYGTSQPSYGSSQTNYVKPQPSYGSSQFDYVKPQPSYGSSQSNYETNKPTYSNDEPTYGSNRPNYDTSQSNYGNNKPSYGDDEDKGYQKPNKRPNDTDGYNIKPVYEHDLDKPPNVPSYIVRPDGGVVTSRPVTVGDYGRPGGGAIYGDYEARRPGYGGSRPHESYKGLS